MYRPLGLLSPYPSHTECLIVPFCWSPITQTNFQLTKKGKKIIRKHLIISLGGYQREPINMQSLSMYWKLPPGKVDSTSIGTRVLKSNLCLMVKINISVFRERERESYQETLIPFKFSSCCGEGETQRSEEPTFVVNSQMFPVSNFIEF